jgi:hypothetical protein
MRRDVRSFKRRQIPTKSGQIHLHAIWLAESGKELAPEIPHVLDLTSEAFRGRPAALWARCHCLVWAGTRRERTWWRDCDHLGLGNQLGQLRAGGERQGDSSAAENQEIAPIQLFTSS